MTKKNLNQAQEGQALAHSQEDHINQVLDQFQKDWMNKITRDPKAPHNLENAVKELRQSLLGKVEGQEDNNSAKDGNEDKAAK